MRTAQHIRVSGVVQGVGFRPFVWRLARELGLAGWVRNDSAGVEIAAEGPAARLALLVDRLGREAPPRARVDAVRVEPASPRGFAAFTIEASVRERCATAIGVDTAVCDECLAELFEPAGRRYRHAFITCTHCGPRYTIAHGLPYDRAQTSMAPFPMCADCAREYADPADRRFHAEPIACGACGPRLVLRDAAGAVVAGDPVAAAVERLRAGGIVAVKGLGGYHLACDARQADAVARLRLRKLREAKPFAVMVANAASLEGLAHVTATAGALLGSPQRPVVLLPKDARADLECPGIAPGLDLLGAMLPATPLQWLLWHEAAGRPPGTAWLGSPQSLVLVMTSANPGGEPIVRDDQEALERLAGIADAYLQHDRQIVVRCDDSVLQDGAPPLVVRRARGEVPGALRLARLGPPVLALGSYLKSTCCVTRGDEAFVGQHVGDLDHATSVAFLAETVDHLLSLLEVQPRAIAHDLHPDFPSTHLAAALGARFGIDCLAVQHHHAHAAAVAGEHGLAGPLLALVLDGSGLGDDGTAWGGELLELDGARCRRVGHLAGLPMPGGDRAASEPWRMAAAALHVLGRGDEIAGRFPRQPAARTLGALLARAHLCPPTTSLGRLFDAAAGLLGVAERSRYEAEAAMRLESLAAGQACAAMAGSAIERDGCVLDFSPLLARLADHAGSAAEGAAVFHAAVGAELAAWVVRAAESLGRATVVLAGGCLLNRRLRADLGARLAGAGLDVRWPRRLPPGDGAISFGQAQVLLQTLEG